MVRFAALLALCSVGCAQSTGEAPRPQMDAGGTEALELRVDSGLPAEYLSAVVGAVGQWESAGASVTVSLVETDVANVVIGECGNPRAAGCAWPKERIHFVPEQLDACNWMKTDGVTQCFKMPLEFMVLHELGHFLGITEHLPAGNVMQAGVTHPMPPAELTEADAACLPAE